MKLVSVDSIAFFLMFLYPGLFISVLNNKFIPSSQTKTKYTETVHNFIFSVVVFLGTLIIIQNGFKHLFKVKENYYSINCIKLEFSNIKFLIIYITIATLLSVIVAILWYLIDKHILLHAINKWNKMHNKPPNTKYRTVWETIFENPDIKVIGRVVSIEIGDKFIVGTINGWTPPDVHNKELYIMHSTKIQKYFDEKYFDDIEFQYIDLDKNMVIKFYNMDKYNQYVEETS